MENEQDNWRPEISAVISCYFEENSITEFHSRLSKALRETGRTHEMIFVNDGSTDRTFELLKEIFESDPNVYAVIDLTRNFGQTSAVMAGLCHARGKAIIHMDSDLQFHPEEIPLLLEKWDQGYEVVSGYRVNRKDSWTRKLPSKIANVIMRKVSESDFRDFGGSFKLYAGYLIRGMEPSAHKTFRPTDIIRNTNRRIEIPVSHSPRRYGKSGWTFRKLWNYNMENVIMMLEKPFQQLFITCLLFANLFILRLIINSVWDFKILPEVTNGLILNALTISTLILAVFFSIQGEFTIRTFRKQLGNTTFIVREVKIKENDETIG